MLSTPVCGVETRKDTVAPLDAPDSRRVAATGITPQEHNGNGMPNKVDLKIEKIFFCPMCFVTKVLSIKTEIKPDTNMPSNK